MTLPSSLASVAARRLRVCDRVEISFHDVGDPAAPAILLLHGAAPGASGLSAYRHNAPALLAAGFRLIIPDLLGFGASSKPVDRPYDLANLTEPVLALLEYLRLGSFQIVGNSFGGAVANEVALRRPDLVERLVLAAPHCLESAETYVAMPGVRGLRAALGRQELTLDDLRTAFGFMVHDPQHIDDQLLGERLAVMKTQPHEVMGSLVLGDISGRIGAIEQPVLAFWGANDRLTPASGGLKIVERCARADLIIWNQTGHWPQVERASQFNALTIAFLTGTP